MRALFVIIFLSLIIACSRKNTIVSTSSEEGGSTLVPYQQYFADIENTCNDLELMDNVNDQSNLYFDHFIELLSYNVQSTDKSNSISNGSLLSIIESNFSYNNIQDVHWVINLAEEDYMKVKSKYIFNSADKTWVQSPSDTLSFLFPSHVDSSTNNSFIEILVWEQNDNYIKSIYQDLFFEINDTIVLAYNNDIVYEGGVLNMASTDLKRRNENIIINTSFGETEVGSYIKVYNDLAKRLDLEINYTDIEYPIRDFSEDIKAKRIAYNFNIETEEDILYFIMNGDPSSFNNAYTDLVEAYNTSEINEEIFYESLSKQLKLHYNVFLLSENKIDTLIKFSPYFSGVDANISLYGSKYHGVNSESSDFFFGYDAILNDGKKVDSEVVLGDCDHLLKTYPQVIFGF